MTGAIVGAAFLLYVTVTATNRSSQLLNFGGFHFLFENAIVSEKLSLSLVPFKTPLAFVSANEKQCRKEAWLLSRWGGRDDS